MWYSSNRYRLERRAARAFGIKDYAGAIRAQGDLLGVIGDNPNTTIVENAIIQDGAVLHTDSGIPLIWG